MTGKKSDFPAGTWQVRCTGSDPNTPARNHTGPSCPAPQSLPLRSEMGLSPPENDAAHCHQRIVSCGCDKPATVSFAGIGAGAASTLDEAARQANSNRGFI